MPQWLPSVPYPPPDQPGFWDPVTSTLQWCEEDYYLTYYSAEIINTLTNIMFLTLSYKGIRMCRENNHDTVFSVAYFGYFLTGLGSFMFHTTLKYPWQLVDELNMIYTTALMAYVSLSYSRPVSIQILLAISLILFCAFITAYYHYLQDPAFHQNVYAAMTVFIVFSSVYKMELSLRPRFRKSREQDRQHRKDNHIPPLPNKEQLAYENDRDMKTLTRMWVFVVYGVSVFLTGFAVWGLDNVYCSNLRRWRRGVGMPWGFFLEFHGIWHLMTGWGAYCYIIWGIHLRYILNGDQDKVVFIWPGWFSLPQIVRKDNTSSSNNNMEKKDDTIEVHVNGRIANGTVKRSKRRA